MRLLFHRKRPTLNVLPNCNQSKVSVFHNLALYWIIMPIPLLELILETFLIAHERREMVVNWNTVSVNTGMFKRLHKDVIAGETSQAAA